MVAMNAETYARDVKEVAPGRLSGLRLHLAAAGAARRESDITVLGVPLARMCNENFSGVRTRILMKNICYAGVLAALLDLDLERIRELLAETYAKKPQLVESNMKAIQLGYDYAKAEFLLPAAAQGREDGPHRRAHHDRRQHRGRARAACSRARRSRPGTRLRPRPR